MANNKNLYVKEICQRCTDKHFCSGLCKEMNEYLVSKKKKSVAST